MGKICIEDMEFYAYHGHYREERIVGNRFLVSLEMETDTTPASKSDNLADALNYQEAYRIVQQEMKVKSHLLEHIAGRILDKLAEAFGERLLNARVKISKMNPPMGGKIDKVSVVMER